MRKGMVLFCILFFSFLLITPVHANPEDDSIINNSNKYVACGDATGIPEPVPMLTSIAYTILIVATPIVLIIFSIIALIKAVTAGNAEEINKAKGKLIKKFITTAVVYFVAGIVQFVVTKAADSSEAGTISSCLNCFLYNSGCATSQGPYEAAEIE